MYFFSWITIKSTYLAKIKLTPLQYEGVNDSLNDLKVLGLGQAHVCGPLTKLNVLLHNIITATTIKGIFMLILCTRTERVSRVDKMADS